MKLRNFLSICLLGASLSMFAQTHAEGVEYFKADQIENAKTLLNRNLNNAGTDKAVSYYYLGRIAALEGNQSEAARNYELGAQANPEYPYNYIGLGEIELLNGNRQVAEKNFKEAENRGKKDPGIHVEIARAYYNQDPVNNQQIIEKRLQKARKINPESVEVYMFEGDVLANEKNWGSAGTKYEMAANTDPNATGAYVKYANLFKRVNPKYSINMLQKLLEANPASALGQRELANAYYTNNNYAKAAEEYGKYVKNPNHFKEDEDRYAFLLFYDQAYQKGYDYATSLLNSNPNNFTARRFQFMNAAQIPALSDKLLPMAENLYNAHKANPSANRFAPIDYILVAEEMKNAKRIDEAVEVMTEAIKELPDNASFNKTLSGIYLESGDYDKAADAYTGYIEKTADPSYADILTHALYAYYGGAKQFNDNPEVANKYFELAKKQAAKASEMDKSQYRPYKVLGDIAIAQAPKAEASSAAEPMYMQAVELIEALPDKSKVANDAKVIYNYLGNYNLDKKDKEKAKAFFNKYLELDPDNADYRKFVNSL
ncbi:MAG: tetratricopeptide repeat protein [Muribaculaceae bacterium]|nr:tetratricopeptide repeat protein [Muribaculaceae bacterium]